MFALRGLRWRSVAQRADESLALGQQQMMHLLHVPAPTQQGTAPVTAALPCRYYTSSPGFLFPQRSEVPKQAFAFCPMFSLAHNCRSSSSNASKSQSPSQEAVIALRPTTDLVRLPASTSALQRMQQQQQQQQRDLCNQQQHHQQLKRPRLSQSQSVQQQQATAKPWLGAQLDVGGYTKKGFISGSGKDTNQDRGLILEEFRSPNELLVGVMDGHGSHGHLVSTYLAQHLPAVLLQKLVAAAAAVGGNSSSGSSEPGTKQRKLFGRGGKQQQQEQQPQQEHHSSDLQFAISQVPYVVVPDHWPKYGFAPAIDASCPDTTQQQRVRAGGKTVSKQQVVEQPRSHVLDDLSNNSSNNSSSRNGSSSSYSYSSSSSQRWLSPVRHNSVQQVALSQELLTGAFTATDWLLSGSGINVVDSGSTALLCHIGPRSVTTAWVGDSRAVLGRRKQVLQADKWEAIPLSQDHKPERNDEYLRINLNEGRVAQIMGRGPYRVWFKGIDYPGLAMSRAFGDVPCRRIGVIVEPEVTVHPLKEGDELLIAASDGIWDVLDNQEVVSLAASGSGAQAAARMLVEVAEARWLENEGGYIDDITAVVVRAKPNSQITGVDVRV